MSPVDLVSARREVLLDLQRSKLRAIRRRDYATADWLSGVIQRQRQRIAYAERQVKIGPRCFTFVNAQFAAADNHPDNAATTGAER